MPKGTNTAVNWHHGVRLFPASNIHMEVDSLCRNQFSGTMLDRSNLSFSNEFLFKKKWRLVSFYHSDDRKRLELGPESMHFTQGMGWTCTTENTDEGSQEQILLWFHCFMVVIAWLQNVHILVIWFSFGKYVNDYSTTFVGLPRKYHQKFSAFSLIIE